MMHSISFQSNHYVDIQWKNLFETAAINASTAKQPMALVNAAGLVMATDCLYSLDRVGLCFENDDVQVLDNHSDSVPFYLTQNAGLLFFRLPFKNISTTASPLFLNFINEIIREVYRATLKMFVYTYEHLSNRQYNQQTIAKIESVQTVLVDTHALLESIKHFMTTINNKMTVTYLISLLLKILHNIAQLGGARSVLKNNALELLFCLKIFQRFIASSVKE